MAMVIENEAELGFRYWYPIRRRFSPDAPFFASGNIEREFLAKQIALDLNEDEKQLLQNMEDLDSRDVYCPIAGCGAHLNSLEEFEDHYNARHTACCSVCSRVFPTSRLLSIHVSESHDSFFQAKVARGYDMYECLVEDCKIKLKSYKSRQQHLVDKHKFPASFEFKKALPSKKQRHKKIQHRRKQVIPPKNTEDEGSSAMQVEQEEDEAMQDLTSAVSKLTTSDSSPSSISFGRRHTRGLAFVPRSLQPATKR